jgi:hypothetical protein
MPATAVRRGAAADFDGPREPAMPRKLRGPCWGATMALASVASACVMLLTSVPAAANSAVRPVCTRARVIPVMRMARQPGERFDFRRSPLLCAGRWAFMEPDVNKEFGLHMYVHWRARAWHNVSIVAACRTPSRLPRKIAQTCLSN